MLDIIRKNIEKSLSHYIGQRFDYYGLNKIYPFFYENLKEYSLRPGKRVRPTLLILSYQGYSEKKPAASIYNASTSIELLHNFMLIHDDIIDRSDLRRGKPTLHILLEKTALSKEPQKLGTDLGIIAGDMLYALAMESLLSVKEMPSHKEKALKYFLETTMYTAMGEFFDTVQGLEDITSINEKNVFLNYTLKTAKYTFEGPLIIGAALAGAPQSEIKKLSELSLLAGQAFQIQDDVIGIFGTEETIGKSILSDFAESKKTLLMAHAFHHLKGKTKTHFIQLFNKTQKNLTDLEECKKILINAGSLQYCLNQTKTKVNDSLKIMRRLKMNSTSKQNIERAIMSPFKHSEQIALEHKLAF